MSDRAHSAQVITDTRNLYEYPVVLYLLLSANIHRRGDMENIRIL